MNRNINCPNCGMTGEEVPQSAVDHQTDNTAKKGQWYTCFNKNCDVAYYTETETINKTLLKDKLFYKDDSEDTYICYCFKISRKDIRLAVENGATTIKDVYKYKGIKYKNDCNCIVNNPTGKCCYYVFTEEINKNINAKTKDSSDA